MAQYARNRGKDFVNSSRSVLSFVERVGFFSTYRIIETHSPRRSARRPKGAIVGMGSDFDRLAYQRSRNLPELCLGVGRGEHVAVPKP